MNKINSTPKWEQSKLTLEQYQQANRYALKLIMPLVLIISGSILIFTIIIFAMWTL